MLSVCNGASTAGTASQRGTVWLLVGLILAVVAMNGWISDDAMITARVLDNVWSGYGPRWNIDNRTQAFSHPLWFLLSLPVYGLLRDPYWTLLLLGLACTLITLVILLRAAADRGTVFPVALALVGSSAWLDYGTSGLENALSHLLVLGFVYYGTPDRQDAASAVRVWWLGALLILNRIDFVALVLPVLLYRRRAGWRAYAALALPLAWMAFATVYYGHPLPNSVLAKLNLGHSRVELAAVGLEYLRDSLLRDPITLLLLFSGVLASVVLGPLRWSRPYFLGALAYVLSIVAAGGDFMSGRFFSVPFTLTLAVFAATAVTERWRKRLALITFGLVALFGAIKPYSHYLAEGGDSRGLWIIDERRFYVEKTGLWQGLKALLAGNGNPLAEIPYLRDLDVMDFRGGYLPAEERMVAVEVQIGFRGFYAGPTVFIVDRMALADPLLSRLPPLCRPCRPGHYERRVPRAYYGLVSGRPDVVASPELVALWRDIHLIAFDDIFAPGRAQAILRRLH